VRTFLDETFSNENQVNPSSNFRKKHVKPIKTKLCVQIASSDQEGGAQVDQVPIIDAVFFDENHAYIAYGTDVLSFEKLVRAYQHRIRAFYGCELNIIFNMLLTEFKYTEEVYVHFEERSTRYTFSKKRRSSK